MWETNSSLAEIGNMAGATSQVVGTTDAAGNWNSNSKFAFNNLDNSNWLGDSFSTLNDTLGSIGKIGGAVSSLANVYLGFQNLDLAKEQLGIKKDQWAMAKQELKHMQDTRKRISNQYVTGSSMAR